MKAAIYLRISKDSTGEGLGVTRQLEDCTEHAKALDWEVVEVYVDNDVSATSGKVRPNYQRMLADMDAGAVESIVAWHADRLYRKVTDLGELVDACKRNNVQIATVKGGTIDLTTPTGRLVAGLLAQVATYEGEAKSDRWKRSWRQGREAGNFARTGSRLFGYTREGDVIEEEAAVARAAVEEVLSGGGIQGICRDLELSGVRTTRGTTWRPGALRQYLRNPIIAGHSTLNGEIVGEGTWAPLIDRESWDTLRALLDGRTRAYVPRVALLNGLLFCGECSARCISGSHGGGQRAYRCPSRPGMAGKGCVAGKALPIEEVVEQYAQTRLADPRVRKRVERLRADPGPAQRELADLEMRIHELEQQLDQPGTPVKTILRAIDRTKERQEKVLVGIGTAPRVPLPRSADEWPSDLRRRRALIDLVVEKVHLDLAPPGNRFNPKRVRIDER